LEVRICRDFGVENSFQIQQFGFIYIVIDDVDDPVQHVLFLPTRIQQIRFRTQLIHLRITPNFQFSKLADMEHVLEYFEIPEFAKQDLETPHSHCKQVQTVYKWDIIDHG
jgi:hypothetical protein